jgi:hypothetical protein
MRSTRLDLWWFVKVQLERSVSGTELIAGNIHVKDRYRNSKPIFKMLRDEIHLGLRPEKPHVSKKECSHRNVSISYPLTSHFHLIDFQKPSKYL